MLDRLWANFSWLVLDGIKDLIDGKPQRGEMLFHSEGSEWIHRENLECLLLESGLPPILAASMGQNPAL